MHWSGGLHWQRPFRLSLDIPASPAAIAIGRREVLPRRWIEDQDGPFQAADVVEPAVGRWNVTPTKMDEECLARVVHSTMGKHVPDIFQGKISLSEAPASMVGNGG
ncbi:MAG: hypothetical protein C4346_03395 [Chloroflexota bacterium]